MKKSWQRQRLLADWRHETQFWRHSAGRCCWQAMFFTKKWWRRMTGFSESRPSSFHSGTFWLDLDFFQGQIVRATLTSAVMNPFHRGKCDVFWHRERILSTKIQVTSGTWNTNISDVVFHFEACICWLHVHSPVAWSCSMLSSGPSINLPFVFLFSRRT